MTGEMCDEMQTPISPEAIQMSNKKLMDSASPVVQALVTQDAEQVAK